MEISSLSDASAFTTYVTTGKGRKKNKQPMIMTISICHQCDVHIFIFFLDLFCFYLLISFISPLISQKVTMGNIQKSQSLFHKTVKDVSSKGSWTVVVFLLRKKKKTICFSSKKQFWQTAMTLMTENLHRHFLIGLFHMTTLMCFPLFLE